MSETPPNSADDPLEVAMAHFAALAQRQKARQKRRKAECAALAKALQPQNTLLDKIMREADAAARLHGEGSAEQQRVLEKGEARLQRQMNIDFVRDTFGCSHREAQAYIKQGILG